MPSRSCDVCGVMYQQMNRRLTCSKDCQQERKALYRRLNPEKAAGSHINYLWHKCKERAYNSGLEFTLERKDIVIPDLCPILGYPMTRKSRYTPSIDRIDNKRGYTPDNIQVISWAANRMKSDATEDELERFAKWQLSKNFLRTSTDSSTPILIMSVTNNS